MTLRASRLSVHRDGKEAAPKQLVYNICKHARGMTSTVCAHNMCNPASFLNALLEFWVPCITAHYLYINYSRHSL